MTYFVGDKSQFYNAGLEEVSTALYRCSECGKEKEVPVEFDPEAGWSFPVNQYDDFCSECERDMMRCVGVMVNKYIGG